MAEKRHLVGVYGSLREHLHNHRVIESPTTKLIGEFKSEPIYTLFSLGSFPGLHKDGKTGVVLEVYEVDDEVFARLDNLEGYDEDSPEYSMYIREEEDTPFGKAWVYFYNNKQRGKAIESGDWFEHLLEQEIEQK